MGNNVFISQLLYLWDELNFNCTNFSSIIYTCVILHPGQVSSPWKDHMQSKDNLESPVSPAKMFFGLWEESREPGENPLKQRENVHIPHRNVSVRIQMRSNISPFWCQLSLKMICFEGGKLKTWQKHLAETSGRPCLSKQWKYSFRCSFCIRQIKNMHWNPKVLPLYIMKWSHYFAAIKYNLFTKVKNPIKVCSFKFSFSG